MDKLKNVVSKLKANKLNVALVGVIALALLGGILFFSMAKKPQGPETLLEDIDLNFDAEGPYAVLEPRTDGNALTMHIKRVGSYDALAYTIAYTDETGIDRGAGSLDTWIDLKDKSEYSQEILFGTCSKGATMDPRHCVFDKGVENGTLTLRFKKGRQPYKMLTQWHIQKPDVALGKLTSGDSHFTYQTSENREDLTLIAYTIINDLTGLPKLPDGMQVIGKVYALNTPSFRDMPGGEIKVELGDKAPAGAKISRYIEKDNKWEDLETKVATSSSGLEASSNGAGIFAVLAPKSE